MPEIRQELVNVCASLLYAEWTKAWDNLKAVKTERDDGSEDWTLFHAERLGRAMADEAKAKAYLNEITPMHTIGR